MPDITAPTGAAAPVVLPVSKRKLLGTLAFLTVILAWYVFLLLTGSKAIGAFGVVVFGIAVLCGVWGILDRRPQLVADANGVTDRLGRHLAWSDVETISIEQLRPELMFVADRKGMRTMVFRARPGTITSSRRWSLGARLQKNRIVVLERAVPRTLEELSKEIERLSGREVVVQPGTARR
jgi:hypothetical protein